MKKPKGEYLGRYYLSSAKPQNPPGDYLDCEFLTQDGKFQLDIGSVRQPDSIEYVDAWLEQAAPGSVILTKRLTVRIKYKDGHIHTM